ncbi:MAG: M20/M25/M40 family metallo-hydrolase [Cyclobacteriaceae bacterium]|nr:M20/M25/M40 family metallo-hydrolase [Cyclobacteriaceae bacterium]
MMTKAHNLTLLLFLITLVHCTAQKMKKEEIAVDSQISEMIKQVSEDSIKSYVEHMVSFETRHALSDTLSDVRGIGAARRWVASKFLQFRQKSNANMTVELDPFVVKGGAPRVPYTVTMKNVVATLKGSDPNDGRVILISGHLDSRNSDILDSVNTAPGANDDASGVAVVIELARVLSQYHFPCTLIFIAVQGEEQGLLGARHMAERMRKEKINLIAMLNNDIVGNSRASETNDKNDKTIRIFSEMIPAVESELDTKNRSAMKSENDSPSRQLARYIKEVGESYHFGFSATLNMRPDRFLRGGDHTPFLQNGFIAVRFTEFNENYNHQHQTLRNEQGVEYGDKLKFMDFGYAANVAKMNLATMASLAKAPSPPKEVSMQVNLSNITNLWWEEPITGPKPKGYNVLMRETYQPFWEKKIYVEETKIELPYSKDNYFFAVQAVGENGHLSQIVIPIPKRK